MLYVWKFFPNSPSDCFNSLMSPGPLSWITLTTCLSLPAQARKVPLGPEPPALHLGALSLWSWPFPIHPLQGHQGSHHPWAGCASNVLGRPLWCQVEEQEVPMRLPTPAQQPACLQPPHSGWAPGKVQGTPEHVLALIPVLPTGALSYSVPRAQRGCSFTHSSQEHEGSHGQTPPRNGAYLGRYPHRAQHPGTMHRALIAEHPQPTCWTDLTLSPSGRT